MTALFFWFPFLVDIMMIIPPLLNVCGDLVYTFYCRMGYWKCLYDQRLHLPMVVNCFHREYTCVSPVAVMQTTTVRTTLIMAICRQREPVYHAVSTTL